MGTGSFPEVKRQGMALTTHPYQAPRLKKDYIYTYSLPLGLFWGELHYALGVKGSRPGRTGFTVLLRGDIGDLRRALAILQER